jgi:D-alanyl-D-alanine carboxypeptidase
VLAVALAISLASACATTPEPAPRPASTRAARSEPERAVEPNAPAVPGAPPPEAPGSAAPASEKPEAPPPPGAQPLAAGDASARLPWVNPARCLASCAFDPGEALRRVNDAGELDLKGRHRVDAAALAALRELLADARAEGHVVKISSAYRSYEEQVRVFRTTKEKGRAARPGHSEHQLGTTIDLRLPTTRAIDWLAAHVAAHGFVLSYPPHKQRITGYRPEPWHVRFVGREIAAQVPTGGTLEELFREHPDLAESGTCNDCPAPASRTKACGRITSAGVCDGTVLSWCFDGALATVDCAAFKHTCSASPGPAPDCVPVAEERGGATESTDVAEP